MLYIRLGIDRLILNLNHHPNFDAPLNSMFVKISCTIETGSRMPQIKVRHNIVKMYVLDLSKGTNFIADWLAGLRIEIWNVLKAFTENPGILLDCIGCGKGRFVAGKCGASGYSAGRCVAGKYS